MGASERDEEARSAFRELIKKLDPRKLVFVDESGTNITLIASLSAGGIGAAMSVEEESGQIVVMDKASRFTRA